MSSFYQDQTIFNVFQDLPGEANYSVFLTLDVLDWTQQPNGYILTQHKVTVPELDQLPVPILRIIFIPLDLPSTGSMSSFRWIFDHYSVPSAFLAGRLQSVTHSFGFLNDDTNGYNCAWFHYLCKNITVTRDLDGKVSVSDPRPGALQLKHGDSTWIRSGYFLRWKLATSCDPEVTLLCFGSSDYLKERFEQVLPSSIPRSVILDPYNLFSLILEQLSMQMDSSVWDLMGVFREIELNTVTATRCRESFTGLHNISKHILFLQESSDAVILTLKSMMHQHQQILDVVPTSNYHATEMAQGMLAHTETHFQSISLRLRSLEKRMTNIIALSFHLVTQDGTQIMREDSSSMATIAFVTLVFLPMSTVSTVFGSQFFSFDSELLRISKSFWIFWLVSIPLTLIVLLFWRASVNRMRFSEIWDALSIWKRRK